MKKRHTPEQIVRKLRQAEAELAAGAPVPEVARRLGISEATFHRWRNHYGGMKADPEEDGRRARSAAGDLRASGVRVIGQSRSSQRYAGRKAERDRPLLERMIALSRENPCYGYRRVWALLRCEGWPVNKKRVYRLWREALSKCLMKQRKRRRLPVLGHGW
jgi:transposase